MPRSLRTHEATGKAEGGAESHPSCAWLLFPQPQPAISLEVLTGALFHQVALSNLEASQIPCRPQREKGDNEVSGKKPPGAAFPLCLSYLHLYLKGSSRLAVAEFCRSLQVPTSKPFIIFNDNNNNPLTCALWTQSFHYVASLPLKSSCLGEEESWTGATSPPLQMRQLSLTVAGGHGVPRWQHVDWILGSSLQFQSSF